MQIRQAAALAPPHPTLSPQGGRGLQARNSHEWPRLICPRLALMEDGVMGLDDPVTRWLPDFKPRLAGEAPTITIRQLLTHTAGLSYGFMQPDDGPYLKLGVSDGMDQPGLSFDEEFRRVVDA